MRFGERGKVVEHLKRRESLCLRLLVANFLPMSAEPQMSADAEERSQAARSRSCWRKGTWSALAAAQMLGVPVLFDDIASLVGRKTKNPILK